LHLKANFDIRGEVSSTTAKGNIAKLGNVRINASKLFYLRSFPQKEWLRSEEKTNQLELSDSLIRFNHYQARLNHYQLSLTDNFLC